MINIARMHYLSDKWNWSCRSIDWYMVATLPWNIRANGTHVARCIGILTHNSEDKRFFHFLSSQLLEAGESLIDSSKELTRQRTCFIWFCRAVCEDKIACNVAFRGTSSPDSLSDCRGVERCWIERERVLDIGSVAPECLGVVDIGSVAPGCQKKGSSSLADCTSWHDRPP